LCPRTKQQAKQPFTEAAPERTDLVDLDEAPPWRVGQLSEIGVRLIARQIRVPFGMDQAGGTAILPGLYSALPFRPPLFSTPIRPPLRDRKFADSLLEGAGFEPSVPLHGEDKRREVRSSGREATPKINQAE
jgi:hypothetical protein